MGRLGGGLKEKRGEEKGRKGRGGNPFEGRGGGRVFEGKGSCPGAGRLVGGGASSPGKKEVFWRRGLFRARIFEVFPQARGGAYDVAILIALTLMNVKNHTRAVYIADFQSHEFFAPHAGSVKRQQPDPMQPAIGGIDEPLHLFPAQDIRQANGPLGIGRFFDAPVALQRLDEEKPQGRQVLRDGVGVELPVRKQVRLILPYLLRP